MERTLDGLGKMIGLYSRRANNDGLKDELFYLILYAIQNKRKISSSYDETANAGPMK
jgi:hypothetical protein